MPVNLPIFEGDWYGRSLTLHSSDGMAVYYAHACHASGLVMWTGVKPNPLNPNGAFQWLLFGGVPLKWFPAGSGAYKSIDGHTVLELDMENPVTGDPMSYKIKSGDGTVLDYGLVEITTSEGIGY